MPQTNLQKTKNDAQNKKQTKFVIGEKVLCYQGSHLYEAKCLKRQVIHQQLKFLVHYSKWKPKYDEWVTVERILKYNSENLKLQQELRKKVKPIKISANIKSAKKDAKKSKILKANSSESLHINPTATTSLKKLTTPAFICKQSEFLSMKEVKIRIPEDLKTILVDDWELITNQKKLYYLPTKFNIDQILSGYFFHKTQSSKLPLNHTIDGYNNFLSNIRKYFNYLLEKHLLYFPMEQEQLSYLKDNYDSLTIDLKTEEVISSQKESRRAWKKYKKSNPKKLAATNKLSTVFNEALSQLSQSACDKDCILTDQNSQTETQDSVTSEIAKSSESVKDEQNATGAVMQVKQQEAVDNLNESKKIDYTKLYGAIHLLRLFSKLGHFLFYTGLNEEKLALLNTYIYDFLKYLSKNLCISWNYSDASYVDSNNFTMNIQK